MKWFALVLALPFLFLGGALLLNRPPMLSPPGPLERFKTYLTTNVAQTRLEHVLPELHPSLFLADEEETQDAVVKAMRSLGWREIQAMDGEVRAVVVSPLFRFRDDVTVRPEATEGGTLLHARSASRVGKGDLAANARHLQALFAEVERLVTMVDPHSARRRIRDAAPLINRMGDASGAHRALGLFIPLDHSTCGCHVLPTDRDSRSRARLAARLSA
ncbi:MAG: DUF1499 domain-containing protein [Chromatiaceae bacterium]|nr:DUF1499 domain-containing protein [Chromatiaceae bacterium]